MALGDKLVTLDGLKAVYQDVNGNIVDLKSASIIEDNRINGILGEINYGYNDPCDLPISSVASKAVSVKRNLTEVILDSNGSATSQAFVCKLNNDVQRAATTTQIKAITNGTVFTSGHTYRVTLKKISGTYSSSTSLPLITVYTSGTSDSIGSVITDTETEYCREFTADGSEYMICIRCQSGSTIGNLKVSVIMVDTEVESLKEKIENSIGSKADKNNLGLHGMRGEYGRMFEPVDFSSVSHLSGLNLPVFSDGYKFVHSVDLSGYKNVSENITTVSTSSALASAISGASSGDTIILDGGVYEPIVLTKSVNLVGKGHPIFVTDDPGTFTDDTASSVVFRTTSAFTDAITDVYDASLLDDGIVMALVKKDNKNDIINTPGSWGLLNSGTALSIYVHLFDGRPATNKNVVLCDGTKTPIKCVQPTEDAKIYLENITVIGGNYNVLYNDYGSYNTQKLIAKNCRFYFSKTYNNVSLYGVDGFFQNCESSYSHKDGFNYHKNNSTEYPSGPNTGTVSNGFEIDCVAHDNGHDDTSASPSDNGSTIHDGGKIVRVNGVYYHNNGGNIADTSTGTASYNYGCYAFDNMAPDGTNRADFWANGNATMNLYGCRASGDSKYNLLAQNGAVINADRVEYSTKFGKIVEVHGEQIDERIASIVSKNTNPGYYLLDASDYAVGWIGSSGNYSQSIKYRICTPGIQTALTDLDIYPAEGYRLTARLFENGAVTDTIAPNDVVTPVHLTKGQQYKLTIRKTGETSSDPDVTVADMWDKALFYNPSQKIQNIALTGDAEYVDSDFGLVPCGVFYPGIDTDQYNAYDYDTTASEVIAAFDALVTANGNYITKTDLGVCSDETQHVYLYDFNPNQVTGPSIYAGIPTIYILCGQHGYEKASVFSLYYMFKHMIENPDDPVLNYLRNHIRILCIPIANPYGFNEKIYKNNNGVNLNRNWDTAGWGEGEGEDDPDSKDYAGSEPFSELETQYARDVFNTYKNDIVLAIDYHTNGYQPITTAGEYNAILYSNKMVPIWQCFKKAIRYHIRDITSHFNEQYNLGLADNVFAGSTISSILHGGSAKDWIEEKNSRLACTFETFPGFIGDESAYSANVIKASEELIANFIITVLNYIKSA